MSHDPVTPTPIMTDNPPPSTSSPDYDEILIQYIVMRSDLTKQYKWNTGSLIGNATHAAIEIIKLHSEEKEVQEYTGTKDKQPIYQMHSVVLSVANELELIETSNTLKSHNLHHKLWFEQPENFATCLAVRPYRRNIIQPLLKHLKLFR